MVRRRQRKRSRHPNKHIEAAVRDAERNGFRLHMAPGHAWGVLRCSGDCPQMSVWSTPRHPQSHRAGYLPYSGKVPTHGESWMSARRPSRFFTWPPQPFHGPPVRVTRGTDEHGNSTIGLVTWAGSLFIVTRWAAGDPSNGTPTRRPLVEADA